MNSRLDVVITDFDGIYKSNSITSLPDESNDDGDDAEKHENAM